MSSRQVYLMEGMMRRWSAGVLIAVLLGLNVALGVEAAQAAAAGPGVRFELSIAFIEIAIDAQGVALAVTL